MAARGLLASEGPGAVTHQRVSQEAGVGRATVYRHWPRSDQLLLDVMEGADLPLFKDPGTPVRPWLRRQLRQLADEVLPPAVAGLSLAMMQSALWDPELARRRDESNETIRTRVHAAIRSAVAGGELETDADPADLVSMLVGPIVYRTAMQREAVPDRLIERLLDSVGTWRS
ncbi:DNA-binding transcriptional regulator, AcrR family [Amycolatopsis pretoriensis]|uniref:DNA-binding transcriptional regulator, AcrR family n=1 Tax=Amycolatopsis pretoriensis TaxID=218821 RepID=A0A1H5RHD0_9PSEU|nr:DNA-binding transcriptional regulator, AcrR family [Amycolatopsis pretoriensis]